MEARRIKITIINQNDIKLFNYVKANLDFVLFVIEKRDEIEILKQANVFNFVNGCKIIRRDDKGVLQRIENQGVDYKREESLDIKS